MLAEQFDDLAVAFLFRQRHSGLTLLGFGINVGTFGDQKLHNVLMSASRRSVKRRIAKFVYCFDVGAFGNKQFH